MFFLHCQYAIIVEDGKNCICGVENHEMFWVLVWRLGACYSRSKSHGLRQTMWTAIICSPPHAATGCHMHYGNIPTTEMSHSKPYVDVTSMNCKVLSPHINYKPEKARSRTLVFPVQSPSWTLQGEGVQGQEDPHSNELTLIPIHDMPACN